jgi:hypothetical protein
LEKEKTMSVDPNSVERYEELTFEEKTILATWIAANLRYVRTGHSYSSYGLKHVFSDSEKGFYICNGQFKGAMLAAGFQPDVEGINWGFRLGVPEFMRKRKRSLWDERGKVEQTV